MPISLSVAGRTDTGRVRGRNEDAIILVPEAGIAVVADGMGGHPGGDVASALASDTAAGALREVAARVASQDVGQVEDTLRDAMTAAVLEAHDRIRSRGDAEPELRGMGTTLTAMILHASGFFVIGHVGDSRAYRLRCGALEQLTRDDTWVQQQIDRGALAPAAARTNPYGHLLTQCLGLDERPAPEVLSGSAEIDDVFLLCSDGLVGMLDDAEIQGVLLRDGASTPEPLLVALVDAANEAGGHDNITVALVHVGG